MFTCNIQKACKACEFYKACKPCSETAMNASKPCALQQKSYEFFFFGGGGLILPWIFEEPNQLSFQGGSFLYPILARRGMKTIFLIKIPYFREFFAQYATVGGY